MDSERTAPTLLDVAREAGVSTATVSRCLNTPERVIESTRERVLGAVERLGYAPNFAARVMAVRRTHTIGAIIPTMDNAIFARGLQAFQEELRAHGYTLLVASSSYDPTIEEDQIKTLIARGADGLLLIGHDRSPSTRKFLETRNVPALVAWASEIPGGLPAVGFDNRASMRRLAEQVFAMGHRHVGIISAPTQANDRARLRLDGIRDAFAQASLDQAEFHVVETDYGVETGARAFADLMTLYPRPTVVMCGNDVLAVGAIRQAREMGIDVPHAVSITGFDDIELARLTVPELTTVHVPHKAMGTAAAKALIEIVEGRDFSGARLDAEIRMRGSLAPPQQA